MPLRELQSKSRNVSIRNMSSFGSIEQRTSRLANTTVCTSKRYTKLFFSHPRYHHLLASEPHSRARMASMTKPDPSKRSQESRAYKLKAIARKSLLKQYAVTSVTDYQYTPPSRFATPVRPKMDIKDSDDYITARAANPRTGLISPSPAATPRTPESPAKALKLRSQRTRPALTRASANEARKISTGGLQKWCADEHGWSREDAKSGVASPRPSETSVGAADIICGETEALEDTLRGDRFVIHMPSAREPQPYAFPGRTAEEIQAYEHYKQKARKTSGDGWDQRRVSGGIRKTSATEPERGRKRVVYGSAMPGQFPTRDGTIIRRAVPDLEESAFPGADVHFAAASFAPYLSPKTPARKTSNIRRPKAVRTLRDYTTIDTRILQESPPITHLSQLPKLRLVRPELASLPMPKLRQASKKSTRVCSLGCDRSPGAESCPQLAGSPKQAQSLFETPPSDPTSFPTEHATALAVYLLSALRAAHDRLGATVRIKIPIPAVLVTLTSPEAGLEERVDAVKTLLTLVGQILGVLIAVSALWKLLVAVAGVVGMLVWPLVVPLKLIWWVMSG